jgi:hypothetical protein
MLSQQDNNSFGAVMKKSSDDYGDLPEICGDDEKLAKSIGRMDPVFRKESCIDVSRINSAFAIGLHMHQPLIPAGGSDLKTAAVISNLQYMMEHPNEGDNHNAPVFHWCYKRMGELIPQLVDAGANPRVMFDYSGCILYGMKKMGLNDVFDNLRRITCEPAYRRCVEWLGCTWGHAVAPSTPVQDFRLHVRAWQQYFASLFGYDALSRVKGFSPTEMALPNHPDVAYEFVKTLKECGFWWVLVQEHTIEQVSDGGGIRQPHIPHRLIARNSKGEEISIVAVIKTQGSDTKLVAQMQPYFEAKGLGRKRLGSKEIPPLVTQISDGENGGVMMNEFPSKYLSVMGEASGSATPAMNVTEYLEWLAEMGIGESDFPEVQPIMQKRIWDRLKRPASSDKLEEVIAQLKKEDNRFNMEGGSWTNNMSWVRGYDNVLKPMDQVSALFAQKVLDAGISPSERRYRNALFHLLLTQTSCYRYWGQGVWTDYARELCRRATEILTHDF